VWQWLKGLPETELQAEGFVARPMALEARTDLPMNRTARVLLCVYANIWSPHMVSSRKYGQRRMMIWHWRASVGRS
jgi:hypothetical protein